MKPLISIVIPVYNAEKYIKKCLDSVYAQTMQDYELIIIDDASEDRSAKLIDKYLKNHNFQFAPALITNTRNCGCATSRNIGMHMAEGIFICFLDADDYWRPAFLKTLSDRLLQENSDFVFCGYDKINSIEHTAKSYTEFKKYPASTRKFSLFFNCQTGKTHVGHWAALYRLDFLRKNKIEYYDRCRKAADTEFVFQALLKARKITCVPQSLYVYYIHSDSITTAMASEKLFDGYYAYRRMLRTVKNPVFKILYYCTKFPRETYLILNKFYKDKLPLPYLFECRQKILLYCILNIIFNKQKNARRIAKWFFREYCFKKVPEFPSPP